MRRLFPLAVSAALALSAGSRAFPAGAAAQDDRDPVPTVLEERGLSPETAERLARAELLAGLTEVQGPGVVVTLRDSDRKVPQGADRSALLIHDTDVTAIMNALRAASAEAIAVGGKGSAPLQRVTATTAVSARAAGIVVNNTVLQQPFRVLAIGEPGALRAELMKAEGVIRKAGLDVLKMAEIEDSGSLSLPAAPTAAPFRFAKAPTRPETPVRVAQASILRSPRPSTTSDVTPRSPVRSSSPERATSPDRNSSPERTSSPERASTPERVTPPERTSKPERSPSTNPAPVPERTSKPAPVKPASPTPSGTPSQAGTPTSPAAPVFGGKGLAKYHAYGCRFGERVSTGDRISFVSAAEAERNGRTACRICLPAGSGK